MKSAYWLEEYFYGLPLVFRAIFCVSVFLVLLILFFYGCIIWNRVHLRKLEKKREGLRKASSVVLADLIVATTGRNILTLELVFEDAVRQLMDILDRNPRFRSDFVKQLIWYQKTFHGETVKVIRRLYISMDLHKGAVQRLRKGKEKEVIGILNEFMHLRICTEPSVLKPFLSDKRQGLRRIARCYCYTCFDHFPVDLLNDGHRLMPWEQIRLYHSLTQKDPGKEPPFHRILDAHAHPSLISLLVHIIVYYRQKEAIPALKILFAVNEASIRREIIYAFGEMRLKEMEEYLIAHYQKQPHELKVEILKALGKIDSHKHVDFLIREFRRAEALELKKHAAKSFIRKSPQNSHILYAQSRVRFSTEHTVVAHVMNPLIKN